MEQGCQLVLLGSGREDLELELRNMEGWNKARGGGGSLPRSAPRDRE